jgi:hydrogenase expression/formation protein HypD
VKNHFRNNPDLKGLIRQIEGQLKAPPHEGKQYNFMEVCGTHTVSLFRYGFRSYFDGLIHFVSGPGCPVCVTSQRDIDKVIALACKGAHITTFGDLMKVPGTNSSLEKEIAAGNQVKVVYSPLESLDIAEKTDKEVVFIAIGFETTIPVIASSVLDAARRGINNFSILCLVKTMPAVLQFLFSNLGHSLDGLICPGHVSVIIGEKPYQFIPEQHHVPCVIAGFEPVDLGLAVAALLKQIEEGEPRVQNMYSRAVKPEGNPNAQLLINQVFQESDAEWRGFGFVPKSGLTLKPEFKNFDAEKRFDIRVGESKEPPGCLCGQVIAGKKSPLDCSLFASRCTPETPVGPCMVSYEGACSAFYKYRNE